MERDAQRYAGKVVAEALHQMKREIELGERNTLVLNDIAEKFMEERGVTPACKGYLPLFHKEPYRHGTCISVNDEIVHGVPSEFKILKEGDVVGLDIVGLYEGWHADSAITVPVGTITNKARKLLEWTERAMYQGIARAKEGGCTGDIGAAVQKYARDKGLGIARHLTGHGIGQKIHCQPDIPNIGKIGDGELLTAGMSISIEPMLMLGADAIHVAENGWAVMASDGSLSAHFEHTVLILEDGKHEILTQLQVQ